MYWLSVVSGVVALHCLPSFHYLALALVLVLPRLHSVVSPPLFEGEDSEGSLKAVLVSWSYYFLRLEDTNFQRAAISSVACFPPSTSGALRPSVMAVAKAVR